MESRVGGRDWPGEGWRGGGETGWSEPRRGRSKQE